VGRLLPGLAGHPRQVRLPQAEQQQLFAIVQSTKGDIVIG
jgi:hypothetical protein